MERCPHQGDLRCPTALSCLAKGGSKRFNAYLGRQVVKDGGGTRGGRRIYPLKRSWVPSNASLGRDTFLRPRLNKLKHIGDVKRHVGKHFNSEYIYIYIYELIIKKVVLGHMLLLVSSRTLSLSLSWLITDFLRLSHIVSCSVQPGTGRN